VNQTVCLQFNESALRRSLKFSFANRDTVVQELLQNAKRAGATAIDVSYDDTTKQLIVSDDGCGIEDFQKLLTVGDSGWNAEVAMREAPYGLGFLSALYAATKVVVRSNGRCVSFETESALDNGTFDVVQDDLASGTQVGLIGFDWPQAATRIEFMARGFGLPIKFNGVEVPRDHADGDEFIRARGEPESPRRL
jgi:hypothetical protein